MIYLARRSHRRRLALLAALPCVALLNWQLFSELTWLLLAWGVATVGRAPPAAAAAAVAAATLLRANTLLAIARDTPPWAPTPRLDMERLLQLGNARPGLTFLELGSGDGRNLLLAAERGLHAVGVETNPVLALLALLRARWAGVGELVTVVTADVFAPDASLPPAHLIYSYLSEESMRRLAPRLRCARAPPNDAVAAGIARREPPSGFARILSRDFEVPGMVAVHSERPPASSRGTRLLAYDAGGSACTAAPAPPG